MNEPTFSWLVPAKAAGCGDYYCPCWKPLPGPNPTGRQYIVIEADEVSP